MRWAITGTPGTGKTTAVDRLAVHRPVFHLNDLLDDPAFQAGVDAERESIIVDLAALGRWIDTIPDDAVIESHVAHLLPVDRVIVLRCHPAALRDRLTTRNEDSASVEENVDAEALDVIAVEAVDRHGDEAVFEIDTTDRAPDAVTAEIRRTIAGDSSPGIGRVSFLEES